MILLALSIAWLAGLGLAAAGYPEAYLVALAYGGGAAAGFAIRRRPALAALTAACTFVFVLGSVRFEGSLPPEEPRGVALLNDGAKVRVRGTVADEPEERGAGQRFALEVDEVESGGAWVASSGKVVVTAKPFPEYAYGDRLEVFGKLATPPRFDSFDYREYLARRGIGSVAAFPETRRLDSGSGSDAKAAVIDVRNRLGDSLAGALSEPEAALARGILLGQRSSIPDGLNDDFNRAGISHLIAISGSNVSLVAGLALAMFTWPLGRRRAVIAAMLMIAGFVVLVGASPSVMRAGIMGAVMLGAVLAGRPGSALTAVAFTAALLTAWQPLSILDVAFQLSFASTVGLVLMAPRLAGALVGLLERALPASAALWLAESTAMTAAASLAVFPIIAANFERASLVAVPANLVAGPLFAAVIVTSFATALAGLVSTSLADLAGRFAGLPLSLMIETGGSFASIPGASLDIAGFGTEAAAVCYAMLAAAAWALARRATLPRPTERRLSVAPALVASVLAAAVAALIWADALLPGPRNLRVTVLDVGQGDAILITMPTGQRVLIDGGPSGASVLNALGAELPAGTRRIDLVVLTHPQEDHVAGLVAVSQRYEVREAAVSGSTSDLASYRAWRAELADRGTPVRKLTAGDVASIGELRLEVLGPPAERVTGTEDDLNNNSVVLRLTYGSVSFLLTGDLAFEGEDAILAGRGDIHATVLKAGHHGSDGSTDSDFLVAVHPAAAVISDGEDNTYGHPSPTTLLRLAGIPLYRTDRNGSVRFETDGKRLFVRPDRGSYQLVPVSAAD